MSRLFDGTDDVMSYALPVGTALNDALTLLIVCKIAAGSNTWLSLLEGERATGATGASLGRRNNNNIYFSNSASLISGGSITSADGWMIVAVTRTAGAATTVHKLPIGGSRTSTTLGALADGLSAASGTMRIGGNDDFANIYVAAAAFWDGTDLTTAQLDGILSAKTTQSILDLSPTWAVDDGPTSNEFANDLVGTTNRTAITGTTTSADDPAGWVYAGEGGGGATHERSAALAATTGIASAGVFWSTLERSAAIGAATAITTVGRRDVLRSAALSAATAVTAAGHGELNRSAALSAVTAIEAAGTSATTVERSAALAAVTGVSTVPQRDLQRSAALSAASLVVTEGERALQRAALLAAVATITTVGQIEDGAIERSASLTATTAVSVAGEVTGVVQRSAALTAATGVAAVGQRDLLRSSTLSAAALIVTGRQVEANRAAVLSAVTAIAASGGRVLPVVSLVATLKEGGAHAALDAGESLTATTKSSSGVVALIE
jgi:hypothetical protein